MPLKNIVVGSSFSKPTHLNFYQ